MARTASKAKAPAKSARRPRGSLSGEGILEGAFQLAEEESVEALSMPKLARRLGVGVTSLYWYYRSKEELLEAMISAAADMYLKLLPDHDDVPWDEHFRRYFADMRRIFHDNPVLCDFLVFRRQVSTVRPRLRFLDRIDHEVSILLDAGFDAETAARGYMAMSVYTQGCVQKQRLFELSGDQETRFWSVNSSRIWDTGTPEETPYYPGLEQSLEYWSVTFATDADFEAGLDLLIGGLRSKLPAAKGTTRKRANTRRRAS